MHINLKVLKHKHTGTIVDNIQCSILIFHLKHCHTQLLMKYEQNNQWLRLTFINLEGKQQQQPSF